MSSPTKLEKCMGAMLASAIGDALGWPNESRAKNTSASPVVLDYFVEWTRRCGRPMWHYEKILPGEYSDDTQMILAVARSIIAGDWENTFAKKELPFWLSYERGGGGALKKAAEACKKGIIIWQSNYARDYFNAGGNGATMRILPHVISRGKEADLRSLMLDIVKDSIITHGHPRAILGATCYAFALNYLLRKESVLEYGELVTAVINGKNVWGTFPDNVVLESWNDAAKRISSFDYLDEWATTLANMLKQLEFIKVSLKKGLMIDDNNVLTQLECFGKVSGAGDVAILTAIYIASRYANNPALGIKTTAFAFGADTDTIASITGGLLGMLCGTSWLPTEWKFVQDHDCFVRITEILLSENMAETAKLIVSDIRNKHIDWHNMPIGKGRLISTSTIDSNKSTIVTVYKYESLLGQTLYVKSYRQNDRYLNQNENQMQIQLTLIKESSRQEPKQETEALDKQVILNAHNIETLIETPELQRITFKKVMRIVKLLLRDKKKASASVAKQMEVEQSVVDLIKTYIN